MDWTPVLAPGEKIRWEGRPAPRCFTFRHWRRSLLGLVLLAFALGLLLVFPRSGLRLSWLGTATSLAGLWLAVGLPVRARRQWEFLFYALTDRRLLVQQGSRRRVESFPLDGMAFFQLQPLGGDLATVKIAGANGRPRLTLFCLEHPGSFTALLEEAGARRIGAGSTGKFV